MTAVAAPDAQERVVVVENTTQEFGSRTIFKDVSFDIHAGEVFVVLGGSGCGKSTLLKQMIGLLPPTRGQISVFGHDVVQDTDAVRSKIGVMFQSGALFGSMNLLENIMLALSVFTDLPVSARQDIARGKLAMVGLADAALRLPAEISGGMAKRAGDCAGFGAGPADPVSG